eukprot:7399954-Pyramimonas_sp.AAC.1
MSSRPLPRGGLGGVAFLGATILGKLTVLCPLRRLVTSQATQRLNIAGGKNIYIRDRATSRLRTLNKAGLLLVYPLRHRDVPSLLCASLAPHRLAVQQPDQVVHLRERPGGGQKEAQRGWKGGQEGVERRPGGEVSVKCRRP